VSRQITFWYVGDIASKSNYRFGYSKKAKDAWAKIKTYETKIGELANEAMVQKGFVSRRGDVKVSIVAYNQKVDIDNVFKATLDGMEGICYLKDSQVSSVAARKAKDKKGKRARITVTWL
jgi:Holliday junction resolvase RusA-like endonuclease